MLEQQRPLLIAHRYGNHLDRITPAVQAGAHVIEIDVWYHRRRLEVGHEKTLGVLPLRWDRWSLHRGGRRQHELATVLDRLPAEVAPMLDLKGSHPGLPEALQQLLDERFAGRPFFVSSQNWAYLDPFLGRDGALVVRSVGTPEMLDDMREQLDDWRGAGIGLDQELLTSEVIAELRERAPLILTWTINDRARASQLLDAGVGGVISDSLEVIQALGEPRSTSR
jgi:glycerophosphoryl diester phosphodiesterase